MNIGDKASDIREQEGYNMADEQQAGDDSRWLTIDEWYSIWRDISDGIDLEKMAELVSSAMFWDKEIERGCSPKYTINRTYRYISLASMIIESLEKCGVTADDMNGLRDDYKDA